jgi:hypothetical protein
MPQSKPRQYIDFKLYLTRPPDGKGCQVTLLPTPEVGETISPVTVPAEKGPPADLLPYLAGKSINLPNLVKLGKGLAGWLLPDEAPVGQQSIRDLFLEALKGAKNEGGVRLRLIIADHALKQWPWEFTYLDPLGLGGPDAMRGFLVLDPRISLVRHEPLPHPHPVVARASTDLTDLRMVIAASSPQTQTELQVDREVDRVKHALQDFKVENTRLTIDPILMDATFPEVQKALQGVGSAYVFHFAGHGITEAGRRDPLAVGATREEGFLYFIGDKATKSEDKVRADDLARCLQAAVVRLAVFGACYSGLRSERYPWDGVASALAARDIPAIVSMQYEVYDPHAIAFTESFYGTLAGGLSLDEAMTAGRLAMYGVSSAQLGQLGFLEWGVPVLYSRLPDGKLFPERMERAADTAQGFRKIIQANVNTIVQGGDVTGIIAKRVTGGFKVELVVKEVKAGATLKGADLGTVGADARVEVKEDVGIVAGTLIGIQADEI